MVLTLSYAVDAISFLNSPLCYFIHFILSPRFSRFFRRLKIIDFLLIGSTPLASLGVGLNGGVKNKVIALT